MPTINLLYKREFRITDQIYVQIPTVGQILDDEDNYYELVSLFTASPIDLIAQLDDAGIDFTKISDFELFLHLFPAIFQKDTGLIFGSLDLTKFTIAVNEKNGTLVLLDPENDIVIDRLVHAKIADTLRKIHHLEKNTKKPANKEAKDYMIKRAQTKAKRRKKASTFSSIESLIISVVNTEQFKYNYDQTLDLTIYQFNESVRQIVRKIDFDNRMYGVYSGSLNAKELSKDDMNWLILSE